MTDRVAKYGRRGKDFGSQSDVSRPLLAQIVEKMAAFAKKTKLHP
jgi:hypothetical protein